MAVNFWEASFEELQTLKDVGAGRANMILGCRLRWANRDSFTVNELASEIHNVDWQMLIDDGHFDIAKPKVSLVDVAEFSSDASQTSGASVASAAAANQGVVSAIDDL